MESMIVKTMSASKHTNQKQIQKHRATSPDWKRFIRSRLSVTNLITVPVLDPYEDKWGLWCQKLVPQAGISNCIPQYSVGCDYLFLPELPSSCTKVLIYGIHTYSSMFLQLFWNQMVLADTLLTWRLYMASGTLIWQFMIPNICSLITQYHSKCFILLAPLANMN